MQSRNLCVTGLFRLCKYRTSAMYNLHWTALTCYGLLRLAISSQ